MICSHCFIAAFWIFQLFFSLINLFIRLDINRTLKHKFLFTKQFHINKLNKKTMLRAMRTVFHGHEHKSCDRDWVPLVVHPFDKHIAAAKLIIHVLLAKRVARQLCGIHGHTLSINSRTRILSDASRWLQRSISASYWIVTATAFELLIHISLFIFLIKYL